MRASPGLVEVGAEAGGDDVVEGGRRVGDPWREASLPSHCPSLPQTPGQSRGSRRGCIIARAVIADAVIADAVMTDAVITDAVIADSVLADASSLMQSPPVSQALGRQARAQRACVARVHHPGSRVQGLTN